MSPATTPAAPSLFADYQGVVAIDPGHGGRDTGAKSSEGSSEKEICLALARRLTHLMEPSYRIVLTRSDDYDINPAERSAIANNQKADLLISIHAAAGFLHTASGIIIYYFQPAGKGRGETSPTPSGVVNITAWRDLQMRHTPASRRLAKLLQQTIETVAGIPEVRSAPAPLVVLQGADMPAVLIEIGHLTHPADEKRLNNPDRQAVLAQAIVKGIESFLAVPR